MKKRKTLKTKMTHSAMKKSNKIPVYPNPKMEIRDDVPDGEVFLINDAFVASEVAFGPAVPEVGSLSAIECTCPPNVREMGKHYAECPSYVEPELPIISGIPHEVLLKALYWVFDFMDRALINFYLVSDTAKAVREKKDLYGDRIQIAVRKNEWESGARRIADAFATPLKDNGQSVEYEYDGVPVIVHILEDSPTLSSFDTVIYMSEYFKLPNPYEQFEKEFSWLK